MKINKKDLGKFTEKVVIVNRFTKITDNFGDITRTNDLKIFTVDGVRLRFVRTIHTWQDDSDFPVVTTRKVVM